jgi:hypothetical protein
VLVAVLLGHAHFGDGGHAADGHFGDAGHAAVGHGAEHAGHGEAEGHVEYGAGGSGSVSASHLPAPAFHFPFFSPLALATLFGALGAWGLIAKQGFGASDPTSLVFAAPAAVLTAYLVTYAGWRLVTGSTGSSQIRLADLAGAPAEVITPIPAGGLGEVAAMVRGQRYSGPAREADGKEVARGSLVTVKGMVGATMVVTVGRRE